MAEAGMIYLCGTPIGNLEDISLRALRIMEEVDLIAAEDTRRIRKLLNYYQLKNRTTSLYRDNEREKTPWLLDQAKQGMSIAVVSSAGMPGISDPGCYLVQEALKLGLEITPIPGPTALISSLVVSGLPTDSFVFQGFMPRDTAAREELLSEIRGEKRTVIFYEAPHRLLETLDRLASLLKDRRVVLMREVTKKHEERLEGRAKELKERLEGTKPRGEFTLLIEGSSEEDDKDSWQHLSLEEHLLFHLQSGLSKKKAIKRVAIERDLPKRQVYQLATRFSVEKSTGKIEISPEE